jgi:YD repeat-containing protein
MKPAASFLKACIGMILLCSSVRCHAQGQKIRSDYYENLSPAKPEKSALGSFGNTKINYFLGMPEVSLDLFTLPGRELSLPVSLSYDPSGVRTDDLAGPAGMKWSLNAGGYIVREMEGLPDEFPEKGYWKLANQTNYYNNINPAEWTRKCENNEVDCAPDLFAINISGRIIRFFFDNNKAIHTIPKQAIKIGYNVSSDLIPNNVRISLFEVTLEDGVKYVFGGSPETVEERKISKLVVRTAFSFKDPRDCPYVSPYPVPEGSSPPDASYNCGGLFEKFENFTDNQEKIVSFYNSRWYLKSIIHPSGESIQFTYKKLSNVDYTLRPSSIRISPECSFLPFLEEKEKYCSGSVVFGECLGSIEENVFHYYNIYLTERFPQTDPGVKPPTSVDPAFGNAYFGDHTRCNPGSVNFYHTLVTESNIYLTEIRTINNNRITFNISSRDDLPGGMKYDELILYNSTNEIIQARKLNYVILPSDEVNDYFWFSEALLLHHLATTRQSGPYLAGYFKQHVSTDILDPLFAKYVFEGVKPYNYKRLFLESVNDVTTEINSTLYRFEYADTRYLKRRTTTFHDNNGYVRSNFLSTEVADISPTRRALIANSFTPKNVLGGGSTPLAGRLSKIVYPTQGYTQFTFETEKEVRLKSVEDYDHDDKKLRQKEFEYTPGYARARQVFESYQDFFSEKGKGWVKYVIQSSFPQNESYSPGFYRNPGSPATIVYHGTKANNNGREEFTFTSSLDTMYQNKPANIYAIPEERNTNGSPLIEIFPFPKEYDRSHVRGLLLTHKVFSRDRAEPITETTYSYTINPNNTKPVVVQGIKTGTFYWTTKESTSFWFGREVDGVLRHRYARYKISADWVVMSRKTEIKYDDDNPLEKLTTITEMNYDPEFLHPTSIVSYLSADPVKRKIIKTKYVTHNDYSPYRDCTTERNNCYAYCQYVNPIATCYADCDKKESECGNYIGFESRGAIQWLRNNNAINTPVEIQTWSEMKGIQTLLSSVVYTYQRIGALSGVKPKDIWQSNQPLSAIEYKSSFVAPTGHFIMDATMQKVHSFNSYDAATQRLLSQSSSDGQTESYEWNSTGSYVTSAILNPGSFQHKNGFTQKLLVGILSSSDANGILSSYSYDGAGKLRAIYRDGQLRTRHFYHKLSDTYKESLTASMIVYGPTIVGQKMRFEAKLEQRPYGLISYSFSVDGKVVTSIKNMMEYTFESTGVHRVVLTKTHPEFGSATACVDVNIAAARQTVICVDGPNRIDIPPGSLAPSYGACTTIPGTTVTKLKASFLGICGPENQLSYKWETLNSSGNWVEFSATGPLTDPPAGFSERVLGQYLVRCTVKDSCGYQATSDVIFLTIM